jgi:hypothetical protein
MKWDTTKKLQTDFIIPYNEVDEEKYWEMLEVLPPEAMVSNAYLVGEPTDHVNGVPRFALYFRKNVTVDDKKIGEKFFYGGLVSVSDFCLWLIPAKFSEVDEINDEDLEASAKKYDEISGELKN